MNYLPSPIPPDEPTAQHDGGILGSPRSAPPPAVAPVISAEDTEKLRALWLGAWAKNTVKAYRSDWEDFLGWCTTTANQALTAHPGAVALYLKELAEQGYAAASVARRVAAIHWVHVGMGTKSPTYAAEVKTALKGIRKTLGTKPKAKAAIDLDLLRRMVDTLPESGLGLRDRALLLVGWNGAFRRSEFVGLRVEDVVWAAEGFVVHLGKTKTDQEGKGATVPVAARPSEPDMCPAAALRQWLAAARIETGPIFLSTQLDGTLVPEPLTPQAVNRLVKKCIRALGMDAAPYGAHSLRSGFVTQNLRDGRSAEAVQRTTRHRDLKTLMAYRHEVDPFAGSVSREAARAAALGGGGAVSTQRTSTAAAVPAAPTLMLEVLFPTADAAALAELRAAADVVAIPLPDGIDHGCRVRACADGYATRVDIAPVPVRGEVAVERTIDLVRKGCTVLYAPDGGELVDYAFVFRPQT